MFTLLIRINKPLPSLSCEFLVKMCGFISRYLNGLCFCVSQWSGAAIRAVFFRPDRSEVHELEMKTNPAVATKPALMVSVQLVVLIDPQAGLHPKTCM